MDDTSAMTAFAALSQDTRLRIVRLLVTAGPEGMTAGAIGEAVGATSSRLSFHLTHLEHATLVVSRREGRFVVYTAAYDALSDLVSFLMRDCCRGQTDRFETEPARHDHV